MQFHGTYDDLLELRKKEKKKTDRLNVPDQSIIPPLTIKKNVQKSQIWLPMVTNFLALWACDILQMGSRDLFNKTHFQND